MLVFKLAKLALFRRLKSKGDAAMKQVDLAAAVVAMMAVMAGFFFLLGQSNTKSFGPVEVTPPAVKFVDSGRYHFIKPGETIAGVLGKHVSGIDNDPSLLYQAVDWVGIRGSIQTGDKIPLPKVFLHGRQMTLKLSAKCDKL